MSEPHSTRPAMRASDTFRIVAVDDNRLDRQYLEKVAAETAHPRCVMTTFAGLDGNLRDALKSGPHLVMLDDDLSVGSCGEASIAWLRDEGYAGPIAILSGLRRQQRNPDLVRAGAMIYVSKDDFGVGMLYELVDMAMALSQIMRARRQSPPSQSFSPRDTTFRGSERRRFDP